MAIADFSAYTAPLTGGSSTASGSPASPFTVNMAQLPSDTAKANLLASPYNVQLTDLTNAVDRAAQQAANASRLGPQGQQIQSNLLGNVEKQSAGLLDPQTEAMLQSGIAQTYGGQGFGVDSPALASAYRRALGQTIESTEAQAGQQYGQLLSENPAAPITSMSGTTMPASTYLTGEQGNVSRAQQQQQFAAQQQLEQDRLAQQNAQYQSELQLKQQQEAERIREFNLTPRYGYGGYGGGGGYRPTYSQSTLGYGDNTPTVAYSQATGTMTAPTQTMPSSYDQFMTGSGAVTPLSYTGSMPVSSGFMGMGDEDTVNYEEMFAGY